MGKKYLEVRTQGKKRVLEAGDIKSIYFFHKKKTPTIPRYQEEDTGEDIQCNSPTDTDFSLEDQRDRLNSMFLP